ncbi:protein NO VEIN domain-containing protein [Xanthobacter versatilis]|uniref:DUF3883 domain-containing protein n=1 Tax=Xanthobacter autotrophicus (strain ATCC BAA-1158 / Py2) TaxID=78245 RepID=UPI0037279ED3
MKKVLWVKGGWSDYYRGGPVDGNFSWLDEHKTAEKTERGHEAFNFMPDTNGTYYCYAPPQSGSPPWNEDNTGWTVIWLAKHPRYTGIHVVGWYENATLLGEWRKPRASLLLPGVPATGWSYCITSTSAYFVSPDTRNDPFSDPSVRQAKYSYLSGPGVAKTPNKDRVLKLLEQRLTSLRGIVIHNPNESNAPDPELDSTDPLTGFGSPEQRKRVEKAAEDAIVEYYKKQGFISINVTGIKCGYDFIFRKGRTELHVEVKGTSLAHERFYMTRNEENYREAPEWRLGIVTNALDGSPTVKIYDNREFKAAFDLEPYVFVGRRIPMPEKK